MIREGFVLFLVGVVCLGLVLAQCPNDCSGSGVCSGTTCSCNTYYEGDDCSIYDQAIVASVPAQNTVAQGTWKYYNVNVPTAASLQWWLNRTSDGDCDLYVRKGARPDRSNFLARNISTLPNLLVVITDASAGTYYAGAYGYRGCTYSIVVNFFSACPNNCNGHGSCIQGSCRCNTGFSGAGCEVSELGVAVDQIYTGTVAQGAWNYYYFSPRVVYSELDWIVTQTNTVGDCDIYLRAYQYPTLWEWDYANVTIGPVSVINQTDATQGTTYYLGVYGYTGCQYNFKLTAITPSTSSDCPNQCSLHATSCTHSKCNCMSGFTGVECETLTYNLPLDYNVTGYVGNNAWNYYHVSVNTVNDLVVSVNRTSATGDCDLYAKANANPTRFDYQYADITVNANIAITIPNAGGSIWYIGVYGWLSCQYSLIVTEQTSCECGANSHGHCEGTPQCICDAGWVGDQCDSQYLTLTSAVPMINKAVGNGEWQYYKISGSESSALSLTLKETNTTGYVWVFLSHGIFPSLTSYDYSDKNGQKSTHQISYYTKSPQSGDLYVGVYGSPFIPTTTKGLKASYNLVVWLADF